MAVSWLKKGDESAAVAQQHAVVVAQQKARQGKAFRFGLMYPGKNGASKDDCESKVLFVDGDLGPKGYLTPPRFYEHGFVFHQGEYHNLICPQQNDPQSGEKCPICEGKDKAYLASLFTVIELKPYTSKKTGEVIPFTRKLMVVKEGMFEMLNKLAAKRGGLKGCVFDLSRTKKQASPNGDMWDFQEKKTDFEALKKEYTRTYKVKNKDTGKEEMKTVCLFEPLDYEKELTYYTSDDLRKMGFGAPAGSSSFQQGGEDGNTTQMPSEGETQAYDKEL